MAKANGSDGVLEEKLRPQTFEQFIGQAAIKRSLAVAISATKKRQETMSHALLYGSPGLGKTTLSQIIASELGRPIRVTSGPAIERTGDLASLLSNLEEGDVLFIDEIHRLPRIVEEMLYPVMEDFVLDVVIGKGLASKSMRLELPKFTLIGATTKIGLISSPMRDRFGQVYHLNFYHPSEIGEIVARSAKILSIKIELPAILEIAQRARRTPRIANRLLARVRDLSEVKNEKIISLARAVEALEMLEIDPVGLDGVDRQVLKFIADAYNGGPVGLSTLAAATNHEKETIEDVIEPYLIQIGFLQRTSRGRMVTEKAQQHLNPKSHLV